MEKKQLEEELAGIVTTTDGKLRLVTEWNLEKRTVIIISRTSLILLLQPY